MSEGTSAEYDRLKAQKDAIEAKKRFFFDTDDDCHWYMIPVAMHQHWLDVNSVQDDESDDTINAVFGKYRIGTHPNCYTFSDPKDEH